jgi:hypothetical protein
MANTTTTRRSTTKRAAAKPAPAPEPEVEDDDLEELEEDEVQESATAKRGSKAADDVVFGVADLCKLLSKGLDKPVTPRELRQLIRKMAREKDPRVNREITAGNRSRYSWSGPKDPEVLAIIAAFKGGELEADKQEKLAALKASKAAKKPAEPAAKSKSKRAAAAAAVEEDDDVEELELDDDDEE